MILAIDTATAACSAALIDGDAVRLASRRIVGRGHAEQLVPMIEALLADAGDVVPTSVMVDCGPGSFTGVRVGIAAAIGLAMGWDVPIAGCSSLALIAVAHFAETSDDECVAALAGGHGELFVQRFAAAPFAALSDPASLGPAEAAAFAGGAVVVGSGAQPLIEARGHGVAIERMPDAAAAALLTLPFRSLPARPIYGRAPDARPKAA